MLVITKSERYKQNFNNRDLNKDLPSLQVLDSIDSYLSFIEKEPTAIERISEDFANPKNLQFNSIGGRTLFFGAVLFSKLLIDELDTSLFNENEAAILKNLSDTLFSYIIILLVTYKIKLTI